MLQPHMACLALLAVAFGAAAAEPTPEIQRKAGTPQAVGALHTLRTIPEACARLQGQFTGVAAKPYAFAAVRSSARCQALCPLISADIGALRAESGMTDLPWARDVLPLRVPDRHRGRQCHSIVPALIVVRCTPS